MSKKKLLTWFFIVLVAGLIGYQKITTYINGQIAVKMRGRPTAVELGVVKEGSIKDKVESAGRIEAVYSVNVVARVQGWLQKRYFKEGAMVDKGALLFLIEPNQYEIAVSESRAAVRQSQATLINAEKELLRAEELVKNDFVSKSYYDQALATRDQNRAVLDANKASLSRAQLNLSYTRITSPIKGRIGKIFITEGNLVDPQTGTLATIVSVDPIYANFTLKSEDFLKFKKLDVQTKDVLKDMDVTLRLPDGSVYDKKGHIAFVDNKVDPSAGTIALRGEFENPEGLLVPGDYVNVVVQAKEGRKVTLVPQIAVSDSTNGYFVYILNRKDPKLQDSIKAGSADGSVEMRYIKVNGQIDGNWIVTDGLKVGEEVVTKGLQNLKPGGAVRVVENINEDAAQQPAEK